MAVYYWLFPYTTWTKPDQFPKEYPGVLYTWFIGKIIYMGSYINPLLAFFGHPLNFFVWNEFEVYLNNDQNAVSSESCAIMFVFLWMSLPYITPFAWANAFYMWYLQIPFEFLLWYTDKIHLKIHYDKECYIPDWENFDYEEYQHCIADVYMY